MVIPIPILQQAAPNAMTNAEWQQFRDDIDTWVVQATNDIQLLNPATQIEQELPVWATNVTTPTTQLGCAMIIIAWLHCVQQQETNLLHLQNLNQQVALTMAAALAQQQANPPPPPPPPHNIPIPHACVKAAHPKAFTSDRHKTCVFMQLCENYFTLTPNMTDKEQIWFTLQLIEGEAKFWKETTLNNMDQRHHPTGQLTGYSSKPTSRPTSTTANK